MGWSADKSSWERMFPNMVWYRLLSSWYTRMISQPQCQDVSNTLHADDFAVWCAEEHTTTTVHCIQNTINEVCSWTESWSLQLNTTKMVSTLFTLSTAKEKVSLKSNNQPVQKFLGVTLDTHTGSRTAESTHTGDDTRSLSKSTWTHVFTNGSAESTVRNGGSGAYIHHPNGTTSSLSIPAGDLSSNYRTEVHTLKAATELLIEEDCN